MLLLAGLFFETELRADDALRTKLLGGEVVNADDYPAVVAIDVDGRKCSATIVGPRVILTAAHCSWRSLARFTAAGRDYVAELVIPASYDPVEDSNGNLDISLGYVSEDILGVQPISIGGVPKSGVELVLLGYGCSDSSHHSDGQLRRGENVVWKVASQRFSIYQPQGGGAACYGDSGGPSFVSTEAGDIQIGVHSRGNLRDLTLDIRLDNRKARKFMRAFTEKYKTPICGVTAECD